MKHFHTGIITKKNKVLKHLHFYKKDKFLLKVHEYPKITKEELRQIRETWPCFEFYGQKDLTWFRIYKKEHGFSPFFIDVLQMQYILEKFNPPNQFAALVNKAMCDVYFPQIPYPEVYVRCLNGTYFDKQLNHLRKSDAVNLLLERDEFIIKPAMDSKSGIGVHKVIVNNLDSPSKKIEEMLENEGNNFVVQEVLSQEPVIAAMNPTSINCCRITTMYMDGKFDYSSMIKVGKKGAKVDNWVCSYFIGMNKNGVILPQGYDNKLNKVTVTDNGIVFGGIKVPFFEKMVQLTENCHKKYFPNCGIIGWDIMVDSKNNPRVIETNILNTGVKGEQLASGTFFESYRDIICEKLMINS